VGFFDFFSGLAVGMILPEKPETAIDLLTPWQRHVRTFAALSSRGGLPTRDLGVATLYYSEIPQSLSLHRDDTGSLLLL
jgi:hypothetical protein